MRPTQLQSSPRLIPTISRSVLQTSTCSLCHPVPSRARCSPACRKSFSRIYQVGRKMAGGPTSSVFRARRQNLTRVASKTRICNSSLLCRSFRWSRLSSLLKSISPSLPNSLKDTWLTPLRSLNYHRIQQSQITQSWRKIPQSTLTSITIQRQRNYSNSRYSNNRAKVNQAIRESWMVCWRQERAISWKPSRRLSSW